MSYHKIVEIPRLKLDQKDVRRSLFDLSNCDEAEFRTKTHSFVDGEPQDEVGGDKEEFKVILEEPQEDSRCNDTDIDEAFRKLANTSQLDFTVVDNTPRDQCLSPPRLGETPGEDSDERLKELHEEMRSSKKLNEMDDYLIEDYDDELDDYDSPLKFENL